MSWLACRCCGRLLQDHLKHAGYCSPQCKVAHEAEKIYEMERNGRTIREQDRGIHHAE